MFPIPMPFLPCESKRQVDVSKCMLIITMVMVVNKWSTYAWDMKRRQLTIHAPWNKTSEWDAHDKVADLLNAALRHCIENFFEGRSVNWENWATVYTTASTLKGTNLERHPTYDFAPEALHFCRTFDGVKQGGCPTAPSKDCPTSADLLFDMLHLKNNSGSLPPQFVEELDD